MTLPEIMNVSTVPAAEALEADVWDDDNRCCYSPDGEYLLDAENFPPEVVVRPGTRVICDGVFAFQPYMADVPIGTKKIPLEERDSFLEKIKLPDSLTHIGESAFQECGQMLRIKLPKNLLYIGPYAFCDCWQLEKVNIPASVQYIGEGAFLGCINLEEIIIPKGADGARLKAMLPRKLHKFTR